MELQQLAPLPAFEGKDRPPTITYCAAVRDIGAGTTADALRHFFEEQCGGDTVYDVKLDPPGRALVKFLSMKGILKALELPASAALDGHHVKVSFFQEKNTVYVGNVPYSMTGEDMKRELERLIQLPLAKFDLCTHPDGKSKGFGWAMLKDNESAIEATKRLTGVALKPGMPLKLTVVESRVPDPRMIRDERTIFVKNVGDAISEDELKRHFGGDAIVERVFFPIDHVARRRLGHAVVEFKSHDQAEDAIVRFNGTVLNGRGISVEWNFRTPRKQSGQLRARSPPPPRDYDRGGPRGPDRFNDRERDRDGFYGPPSSYRGRSPPRYSPPRGHSSRSHHSSSLSDPRGPAMPPMPMQPTGAAIYAQPAIAYGYPPGYGMPQGGPMQMPPPPAPAPVPAPAPGPAPLPAQGAEAYMQYLASLGQQYSQQDLSAWLTALAQQQQMSAYAAQYAAAAQAGPPPGPPAGAPPMMAGPPPPQPQMQGPPQPLGVPPPMGMQLGMGPQQQGPPGGPLPPQQAVFDSYGRKAPPASAAYSRPPRYAPYQ